MRVYLIARNYQATEIETADAARRFLAWLTGDANPVLAAVIQSWMWRPADTGGLGALAESAWDIALLRAEVTAVWQSVPAESASAGQPETR
jgi:hypothetical protein